ncbi:RNA polymerase sigma-54 factor RpoN [hydrothermal vent metagenome]|uniref:RNA polymerase sigma-54 factor RpoN n=2 Tax=hydrothermal vent metagenome TaxID=652676 RepID=A0A3B1DIQ0_9ZZZZ
MRFETSQSMRLGQHMKLAPRVIQSMEILQMPLTELEERIEQELASNPTIEIAEIVPDPDAVPVHDEPGGVENTDDFSRLAEFESTNPDAAENTNESAGLLDGRDRFDDYQPSQPSQPSRRLEGERDGKMDAMAAAPAREASLGEQLRAQWGLVEVEEQLRYPGELIIGFLDDDGYLRTPLEMVIEKSPPAPDGQALTPELLERALTAVQLFLEPAGVAARDARECLLLQLDVLEDRMEWDSDEDRVETLRVARMLVVDHLDDLMQNRLPKIAEQEDVTLDQIKAGLELLRRLSLAPARRLVNESAEIIIPDAIVEYDEEHDRYIAYLNDTRLPNLRINKEYAEMIRDRDVPKKDRDFLKTNIGNAQWLIEAVEQRRRTVQRVLNVVVDAQRDFFDYGPQAIKPLPMTLVAEQLGIHVATVSRAVADKHLVTPRGVVPLRRFFTGGTETASGEEISWEAIKAALQEVIDEEDKTKPLSDEALAKALTDRGIEIARRTVAKYRGQLGIPNARLRKQF